jgi:hypothetical protein
MLCIENKVPEHCSTGHWKCLEISVYWVPLRTWEYYNCIASWVCQSYTATGASSTSTTAITPRNTVCTWSIAAVHSPIWGEHSTLLSHNEMSPNKSSHSRWTWGWPIGRSNTYHHHEENFHFNPAAVSYEYPAPNLGLPGCFTWNPWTNYRK